MSVDFVAGEYWTPERTRDSASRMAESFASPEMQSLMSQIAKGAAENGNPAALAAALASDGPLHTGATTPVAAAACRYRRSRPSDLAELTRLIIHGDLPPMFIEEFIEGFVAVEHDGEIVGCGGLELYGDSGVIRSVVVDERGRGQRIGEHMTELLMADARSAGLLHLYLFTMHAHEFWLRHGFTDVPLEAWEEPPRVSWQYQFVSQFPQASSNIYSMWRAAGEPERA
jgi:amino-acid N-acetyltransferase